MDHKQIIMNYTTAPDMDDIQTIADTMVKSLPDELQDHCEDLSVHVEEWADDTYLDDLGIDDPYELLVSFRKGTEISPGVESTNSDNENTLYIFRRPFLDLWSETGEDFNTLIWQIIIEELGMAFEVPDADIDEMIEQYSHGGL